MKLIYLNCGVKHKGDVHSHGSYNQALIKQL